jgi:NAD-dependent dihydropyrimidine dehydrogenase PreA subunit
MPAIVDAEKCTACKSCVDVCPSSAIAVPESVAVVTPDECIDCAACQDACTTGAISME